MDRQERAKQVKAAYERVFESDDGKVVLYDLINSTGFLQPSVNFQRHNISAIEMAFADGCKSIVSRIIEQVQLNPEKFVSLIKQKNDYEEEFEL